MSIKKSFFILSIFFTFNAFSQLKITGKIVDSDDHPLEMIEALIMTSDSIAFDSSLTDEFGLFELKTQKGKYIIQFRNIGTILFEKVVEVNENINFGIIKVDNTTQLKEITIEAKKKLIERKVDRIVFNVENSISATGGDAIDALKVSPGIRVQNDQITMIGKSGMAVMVDDRLMQLSGEDLINFLKSIPSDNIKSIEVITTPPAKYDAEGNSGIVNIILKKAKADSWNATLSSSYKQSKFAQFNESFNFNLKKNKFTIYSSMFHNDGLYYYRIDNSNIFYSDKYYYSESKMKFNYSGNLSLNFGLDYEINKKLFMGIQFLSNSNQINSKEENDVEIYSVTDYLIRTFSSGFNKTNNNSVNIHSTYNLDTIGSKVTINSDFFKFNSIKNRTFEMREYENFIIYNDNSFYSANNLSNQDIINYATQLDVDKVFKKMRISFGGKTSFTNNISDISYYNLINANPILELDKSDKFEYFEKMHALYFSGNKNLGKKWESQLGLRLESTLTEGYSTNLNQTNRNKYTKLFPTFYLLYNLNDNNSISFNYSKRIGRPSYTILNPFVRYINSYTTSEGNPFLKPFYNNNIEINYTFKDHWINTFYYSKENNKYQQVNYITNNNINSETKFLNFYDQSIIGLNENYNINLTKNWKINNYANIYYQIINSSLPQSLPNYEGWSAFFSTNNNFTLNKNGIFTLSIDYAYQFPKYDAIYKTLGYSYFNLGFKALLLKKELNIVLNVSDLFRTQKMGNESYLNNIKKSFQNYEDRQSFRLTMKYNFGNNKIKIKNIKYSNEEEKRRAN